MPEASTDRGSYTLGDEIARPAEVPPILFVGGTGRSGTHVLARMYGKNQNYRLIPVEVRFHVEPRGFPGLLAGEVSKRDFLRRLRGFWWKGFQTSRLRGMFRFVPREQFDAAADAFDAGFESDPEGACRRLFYDLLYVRGERTGSAGIVEQSCDTVAEAATLVRLFPEARFVHVVRDGRDASASRVAQARGLLYPRTRRQGIEWWEARLRRIDSGSRAIPAEHLLTVSLDELLPLKPRLAARPLLRFVGARVGPNPRRFIRRQMSAEAANAERWRRGLSTRRAERVDRLYSEALARLEAEGVTCAPLLRRTFERRRGADLSPLPYVQGRASPEAPSEATKGGS